MGRGGNCFQWQKASAPSHPGGHYEPLALTASRQTPGAMRSGLH